MLRQTLFLLPCASIALAGDVSWIANGTDFFPVVVAIRKAGTEKAISDAVVSMDHDANEKALLVPGQEQPANAIRASYYKPRRTDALGMATLFYFAKYFRYTNSPDRYVYVRGKVKIGANGFRPVIVDLSKDVSRSPYKVNATSAFYIEVHLEKIVNNDSEPAGADQPATKPGDKASEKDKPSTPTSKAGSR